MVLRLSLKQYPKIGSIGDNSPFHKRGESAEKFAPCLWVQVRGPSEQPTRMSGERSGQGGHLRIPHEGYFVLKQREQLPGYGNTGFPFLFHFHFFQAVRKVFKRVF